MLNNVIVENNIIVGLYTCTRQLCVVVCIYEEHCLTTSCDTVVSCLSISVPSMVCVSAPSSELHKP